MVKDTLLHGGDPIPWWTPYRVPDTPGSLFSFNRQFTSMGMNISPEGKSQISAVQNLCILTRKKNRPTVGTGADR